MVIQLASELKLLGRGNFQRAIALAPRIVWSLAEDPLGQVALGRLGREARQQAASSSAITLLESGQFCECVHAPSTLLVIVFIWTREPLAKYFDSALISAPTHCNGFVRVH